MDRSLIRAGRFLSLRIAAGWSLLLEKNQRNISNEFQYLECYNVRYCRNMDYLSLVNTYGRSFY